MKHFASAGRVEKTHCSQSIITADCRCERGPDVGVWVHVALSSAFTKNGANDWPAGRAGRPVGLERR
jgi:hypothetical protein